MNEHSTSEWPDYAPVITFPDGLDYFAIQARKAAAAAATKPGPNSVWLPIQSLCRRTQPTPRHTATIFRDWCRDDQRDEQVGRNVRVGIRFDFERTDAALFKQFFG